MYKSRLTFSGETISIALDSLSGELLEFRDMRTGENFIKNSLFTAQQPFIITCKDGKRLYPPSTKQILKDRSMQCEITQKDNLITVHYSFLTDGEMFYPEDVTYTVKLDGQKTHWKLFLPSAYTYSVVRFPCINGVYLGNTWKDDVLYYPVKAGRKYINPVEYFARPVRKLQWRWQEYRYFYTVDGCCGEKNDDDMYVMSSVYPGGLSMSYFDYADEKSGLYFASHSDSSDLVTLGAATPGPDSPCMCFFAEYEMTVEEGASWQSPDIVVAAHGGDWHEGADIYRSYKEPLLDPQVDQPEWFKTSAAMLAHYDFKYQNGGVVHTYRDIPSLKKQAEEFGIKHLMYAGWHMDGFDNGFPQYYPDPELGTEQELYEGCRLGADGIHTSFYINSRIANLKYKDVSDRIVIRRDGSQAFETYGNKDISFGCMCPSSLQWQTELLEIISRAKQRYGVDGIYLDQLSSSARFCFSKSHGHEVGDWCKGYKKILTSFAPLKLALMGEHVCDEYGPYVTHFAQTFFDLNIGTFPEMYRYTFPNHTLMDVLYPSQNLAMRPVFVEQNSDRLMRTAFVDGMYFWIYDLEEDNTFRRDPKQFEKLKQVIKLRTFWLEEFGAGIFRDTVPISILPQNCFIRYYEMPKGALLAIANSDKVQKSVTIRCESEWSAMAYSFKHQDGIAMETTMTEHGLKVMIPEEEYVVIRLM